MDIFYPIQLFADFLTYTVLSLSPETHSARAVNFFVYDTIKIIILLLVITQVMSFVNVIFPVEKIRDFLSKKKLYGLEYFLASVFGAITPFCSCSSIPLFIGFLKWGIPLGITFSFLISSPLVNEVALAMLLGIFWLKITMIYAISGIALWMVGGFILWKLKLEKYVADFIWKTPVRNTEMVSAKKTWRQVWQESSREWLQITKKILPYVLLGVAIGAWIHRFIPEGFFAQYISKDTPFAVPIAVILWIPMYANATSVIPIIQALIAKWVPLGTGLAFMMAVVGLSLPEFLILKKVMKLPLLFAFFATVWFCIILLGYFYSSIF